MKDSFSELNIVAKRSLREEQIANLRRNYPKLMRVEAELLRELGKLTSRMAIVEGLDSSLQQNEDSLISISALRRERQLVLEEMGLISRNDSSGGNIRVNPAAGKVDMQNSRILAGLRG